MAKKKKSRNKEHEFEIDNCRRMEISFTSINQWLSCWQIEDMKLVISNIRQLNSQRPDTGYTAKYVVALLKKKKRR